MRDRLLTQLFLRRFLENDLISPDADRREVLAVTGAVIISTSLFVTTLLSLGSLLEVFPSPGRSAVHMLSTQCLYVTSSMVVMALLAVAAWDALALDSRDTAILGPLPLGRGVIVRAKLSALIVFVAACAGALNLAPGLVQPVAAVSRLRPSALMVATLIIAHLTSTMSAGTFGFIAVLGLREVLHTVLGTGGFRRVSVLVQGGLVVSLATVLLLAPALAFRIGDQWLAHGATYAYFVPPLWFVGIHDTISGHIWDQLPRPELPARIVESADAFETAYHSRRPQLRRLGDVGSAAFFIVLLGSTGAYLWNSRRLPEPPSAEASARGRGSVIVRRMMQRLLARRPPVQAIFFFTMRILARSVPHRLSIAVALAAALAVSTITLRMAAGTLSFDPSAVPLGVFATQTLLIAAVVAGFRHAIRVPVELRATWVFQVTRGGQERTHVDGAKCAAFVKLLVPTLMGLWPFHIWVFGWQTAVLHFTYGVLTALIFIEVSLLGFRKRPFASAYVPAPQLKTVGSMYVFIVVVGLYTLAWLERLALRTTRGAVVLYGVTLAALVVIRAAEIWQWRSHPTLDGEELPEPNTLQLGLAE